MQSIVPRFRLLSLSLSLSLSLTPSSLPPSYRALLSLSLSPPLRSLSLSPGHGQFGVTRRDRGSVCPFASSAKPLHKDSIVSKPSMLSVKIKCQGDIADDLTEALMCFGASSVSIEDANLGSTFEQKIYSDGPIPWDTTKRQLWNQSHIFAMFPPGKDIGECLAFAFDSIGLSKMLPYEVEEVENQDWVQQMKDSFQPIQIVDGMWIVPKWCTPPDSLARNIVLDPGLAFGTGDHPTTRLCLRWISEVVKDGHILDYGTGSGILAIAALKMGATKAVGVDIDPIALSAAAYNASLNAYGPDNFQVIQVTPSGQDFEESNAGKFDIVVANLLLSPLLDLSNRIMSYAKIGSCVGLSGILNTQVEYILEKYSDFLDNIQVTEDDGWACVSGTRK